MNRILTKRQSDYLLEISLIPVKIRRKFLNRLYFRKNGVEQKNYKLLQIIERIIESGNFKKWNEELICKKLNVTNSLLACLKSRILKALRTEYFKTNSIKNFEKESIDNCLSEIKNLEEKGCYREAMPLCFVLVKRIIEEVKKNKKTVFYVQLSELYYIISQFYFYNKNQKRFKKYYFELEKLKRKSSLFKNKKEQSKILAAYYLVKSQLFLFRQGNNKYLQMSMIYKLKSLDSAEKINDGRLILRNLIHLARIYRLLGETENARNVINKGLKYSQKISNNEMYSLFEVLDLELNFIRDKKYSEAYYKKCLHVYSEISPQSSFECVQTINFKLIGITSYLDKEEEIRFFENEYVRSLALRGKKYEAFERRFWQNAEWQRWKLYKWKIENKNDDEHYTIEPDAKVLDEMSEQIVDYTRRNYKIYNASRLLFNFLFRIDVEYWKGENADYETMRYFLNKTKRLIKSTKVSLPRHNYLNFDFLVNLLNEGKYNDKKETYLKYAKQFDEVVASLKTTTLNVIEEYAKIAFAAKILNLKMFTDEVLKLEKWLKENRPQLFEPIREIVFNRAV